MRLEHLCRVTMRYTGESSWHQPYQRPDGTSEQEFGHGAGTGSVTGDVFQGSLTWVNFPARREDGVWMPNLRGIIKASDGGELLLSFTGLSIDGDFPQPRRAIVGHVDMITEHEPLRWLNTCFLVGEARSTRAPRWSGGWTPTSASMTWWSTSRLSGFSRPRTGSGKASR
jgi:hypothetical protein